MLRSSLAASRQLRVRRTLAVAPASSHVHISARRHNSSNVDAARWEAKKIKDELQVDWDAPKVTYEEVKRRTEQPTTDAYIIDVREPDEVIQGSLPSSVNLPLSVISDAFHMNPVAFKEKFGFEKPKRQQEIVFYCRSGKRSASACDIAKRNEYKNVHNYAGSWLDWISREGKN